LASGQATLAGPRANHVEGIRGRVVPSLALGMPRAACGAGLCRHKCDPVSMSSDPKSRAPAEARRAGRGDRAQPSVEQLPSAGMNLPRSRRTAAAPAPDRQPVPRSIPTRRSPGAAKQAVQRDASRDHRDVVGADLPPHDVALPKRELRRGVGFSAASAALWPRSFSRGVAPVTKQCPGPGGRADDAIPRSQIWRAHSDRFVLGPPGLLPDSS
jgi:hypothetical protein